MMNNIYISLFIMMFLSGLSCSCQVKMKCRINSIDTTSLDYYSIIKVFTKKKEMVILSEKKDSRKGKLLQVGDCIKLNLNKANDLKTNANTIIRIGSRGYFIDGVEILEPNTDFYESNCLDGLYYVCGKTKK